jgi:hypothetical protein
MAAAYDFASKVTECSQDLRRILGCSQDRFLVFDAVDLASPPYVLSQALDRELIPPIPIAAVRPSGTSTFHH